MGAPSTRDITEKERAPRRTDGRRYEALLRLSEALSACDEPEELTKILSQELREFLDFFEFYIVVYKQNSTEIEWAVVGPEKSQVATYRGVPVQDRPSWRVYTTQEPYHIHDWNTDTKVAPSLKQNLAGQGTEVGPVVFVPLTTSHRRLGALGMSGTRGTVFDSEDVSFLRLIGRVVALAIDDNFNLTQAETARAELERQNDRLQLSERELRELIETIPEMAWTAAPDGSASFVNGRWSEYTGHSLEATVGFGWKNAIHPGDLSRHMDKWQNSVATGEPFEHEVRFRRGTDGQYRWFLVRGIPLKDERGKVLKWYGIATDIDDRKSSEHALCVQNNRLRLLLNLTSEVTSNLDLREVLRSTSAYIREAVRADAAGIAFFDPSSGKCRIYAVDFPNAKGFVKEEVLVTPGRAFKRVWESSKPDVMAANDREELGPEVYELVVSEGLNAHCLIPLVNRGRPVPCGPA